MNVRILNQNFESLKVTYLTQTWCTNDPRNETLFNLENYTSINQVRKHGRGGGTCVSIHNSLTFKLLKSNDIDSLVTEILNTKGKNFVIGAQYRQPVGDFKQYKTHLENFLK